MKITCPTCNAIYNIPDDKIPQNKRATATCKKCGTKISIKTKMARATMEKKALQDYVVGTKVIRPSESIKSKGDSKTSRVNALPLIFSKTIRIGKEGLFVLKYALSFAALSCVLSLVILVILDIVPYTTTTGETEILSFSNPTFKDESPGNSLYILWIGGIIGFLIGWVIGSQRLKVKNLSRTYKRVYRK